MKMDSDKVSSNLHRPWFTFWIFVGAIGLLAAWLSIPNFVRGGSGKATQIIYHLRQIEAAKEEWAFERGITNLSLMNRELIPNDLSPYLVPQFTKQDFGDPIDGERYFIGPLDGPCEAVLVKDLIENGAPKNWKLPKGTIIRLGTNNVEACFLPGHNFQTPMSLYQAVTNNSFLQHQ